ncbi:MAG TPA: molybdenum ABC transporter ATP-binding protein [Aestuariivirgaceae bacterium]|jgi:molybdate transport system ATP-binding protein|nr:molybdenum ABC transporter ATP-binding protein [Aestuariivirgaceae bacterium]
MSRPDRLEVALYHRLGDFTIDIAFRTDSGATALFGPSGSGKTTVLHAIAGLLRPERGRIVFDGRVMLDTASSVFVQPYRREVGYVFQDARLFPHLTVRQNLLFGRFFAHRQRRRNGGMTLENVVGLLGIDHILSRRPVNLSGGERQRVAIGRALLAEPCMLLMDEPLAALDAARKAEILPVLERLRDVSRVPILYVSHDVSEVSRIANNVIVMENGRAGERWQS